MGNNDKFKVGRELKALVAFLASGAFVAVHKEFMQPDFFPDDHWTNHFHHVVHFGIGALLQLVFLVLLVRLLVRIVWHVVVEPICLHVKGKPENIPEKTEQKGHQ